MYIHIQSMAKTIMIGNDVYKELKERKGERSFTEVIRALLDRDRPKTGRDLLKHFGTMKDDKEWDEVKKGIKKGWAGWNRRYS